MNILSVSQINSYIKSLFDGNAHLKKVYIRGEILSFSNKGHLYLTLKDETCQIKAMMHIERAKKLNFKPVAGEKVVCSGKISVYQPYGEYRLYIDDMQREGLGELYIGLNQLKEKLKREGLFDDSRKKAIPKFPKKIGVATSNTGAAVEDIKNIAARRYPLAEIVIAPTLVQGDNAPADIVESLKALDSRGDLDVIIVGRGGGSAEDLWAFNDESVARAVAECKTPVVSAVGHKTDTTICDFVADLSAPTPSAAAELVCPDIGEMLYKVKALQDDLNDSIDFIFGLKEQQYKRLASSPMLQNYDAVLDGYGANLSALSKRLAIASVHGYDRRALKFGMLAEKLNALSPLAVLARGYSVAQKGEEIVKNVSQIKENDNITLVLNDGKASCTVREVIKNG